MSVWVGGWVYIGEIVYKKNDDIVFLIINNFLKIELSQKKKSNV